MDLLISEMHICSAWLPFSPHCQGSTEESIPKKDRSKRVNHGRNRHTTFAAADSTQAALASSARAGVDRADRADIRPHQVRQESMAAAAQSNLSRTVAVDRLLDLLGDSGTKLSTRQDTRIARLEVVPSNRSQPGDHLAFRAGAGSHGLVFARAPTLSRSHWRAGAGCVCCPGSVGAPASRTQLERRGPNR